jgi:hypothetical protein
MMKSKIVAESKFKEGDVVVDRTRPTQKLVIDRYLDQVYYCKDQKNPKLKELVYLERELIADTTNGNRT